MLLEHCAVLQSTADSQYWCYLYFFCGKIDLRLYKVDYSINYMKINEVVLWLPFSLGFVTIIVIVIIFLRIVILLFNNNSLKLVRIVVIVTCVFILITNTVRVLILTFCWRPIGCCKKLFNSLKLSQSIYVF